MSDSDFASLGPTLLARKGGAKPAMRPQHGVVPTASNAAQNLEDLGWNDMGDADEKTHHEAEILQLTPAPANPEVAEEARHQDEEAQAALAQASGTKPEVVLQQEAIAEKIEAPADIPVRETPLLKKAPVENPVPPRLPRAPRKRTSALKRGKRAAFTLRLDAERHLKLRLACTVRNCSAQQLVTDALDHLLGEMPDLDSLATQVRSSD